MDETVSFSIPFEPDEEGFFGRECPECESYFKIVLGTGLKGEGLPCHCPYCGHVDSMDQFWTQDQIEFAKSYALQQAGQLVYDELKKLEFNHKAKGPFGIGISMKLERGSPIPIQYYREKRLETKIVCDNCGLHYSVYGVFAYCPDCGQHSFLEILNKNLEVITKMADLAESLDEEMKEKLIENALEDCVSVFDGFGRSICTVYASKARDPERAKKVSFQDLARAKNAMKSLYGIDISTCVSSAEWTSAIRSFQKRHLVAHRMGVVDAEYLEKTGDADAKVGRKVSISTEDIEAASRFVKSLGEYLTNQLGSMPGLET